MKEKLLKIILVVLLIFSTFPRFAYAEEEGQDTEPETSETITVPEEEEEGEQPAQEDPAAEPEDPLLPGEDETEAEEEKELSQKVEDLLLEESDLPKQEEEEEEELYVRTILMYACGSDLESVSGLCSYNLEQILNSHFSKGDRVKFIVMTGGADENDGWQLSSDYLYDPQTGTHPSQIGTEYNSIWEVKGLDADEYPGKLVLLDGDGVLGDGEDALPAKPVLDEYGYTDTSYDYEWMSDPEVLRAFINYGVQNYPAEKYDLILWNHGGGPMEGFGKDEWAGELMPFAGLIDALSNNSVIENNGRFDIINFDACLMNSIELTLAFAPYTDYYIASPELVPGDGESYEGWLNMLGEDPDIDGYTLGTKLVDDFFTYYEEGEGTGQDATMALVNTTALLNSGIVDDLIEMSELMSVGLDEILSYDELSSFLNSIHYGNQGYYVDLGNMVSQICVAVKEFDEDHMPIGGKDLEVNAYYNVAMRILNVLEDESINYNCGTRGIRSTEDFIYRDKNGDLLFSDLRPLESSGTYIFCTSVDNIHETENYLEVMSEVIKEMPDGNVRTFFNDYCGTMTRFDLLIEFGKAITKMVNEGFKKEDFDYQYVKDYMKINDPIYEEWGFDGSYWHYYIEDIVGQILEQYHVGSEYECPEFMDWMERMVRQMADEAIDKNKIELYAVDQGDLTAYQIKFNDTKKRVIEKVGYNVVAELPILEKWIDDNDIRWMFNSNTHHLMEMSIGTVAGTEAFDMDLDSDDDFMTEYIRWLNEDTATWNLAALEDRWYALVDGEGKIHIAYMERYHDYLLIPVCFEKEYIDEDGEVEVDNEMVALFFNEEGDLISFMMKDDSGVYRPVEARNLRKDLTVTTCMILEGIFSNFYGPMSTEFTITPENVDQIKLIFTDIENMPDDEVTDVTGDGKCLTKQITVTNIYGTKIDISDMIENPTGYLTDIMLVKVLDDEYTGEELSPRIVYDGRLLKEGVDYRLIKMTDDTIFREVGRYVFELDGLGEFTGKHLFEYYINAPAPQYLIIDGANAVWTKGSSKTCDFRFKRNFEDGKTFDLFDSILVDGEEVDSSAYTLEEGSVIIRLKPSFLQKLSVGDHSIKAVFKDAESKAIRFTIKASKGEKEESRTYALPLTGIE